MQNNLPTLCYNKLVLFVIAVLNLLLMAHVQSTNLFFVFLHRMKCSHQEKAPYCTAHKFDLKKKAAGNHLATCLTYNDQTVSCAYNFRSSTSFRHQVLMSMTSNTFERIFLLSFSQTLFPRGEKPNPLREKYLKINGIITESAKSFERIQVSISILQI